MNENDIPLWVLDLLRLIKKTEFGEIPVTLKTDRGKVASLTTNAFRTEKFQNGSNARVTAEVLALIKNMVDTKQSGMISFTLVFNEGQIRKLINQYSAKNVYSLNKGDNHPLEDSE